MRKALFLIGLFIGGGGLAGCTQPNAEVTFVEQKWPILPRPTLKLDPVTAEDLAGLSPDGLRRLRNRDERMKTHIRQLEIAIDEYNAKARKQNKAASK